MIESSEWAKMFQENYELITENINELITIINQNNEVEYINNRPLIKSLGYIADDLMGNSFLNIVYHKDLESVINLLEVCTENRPITQKLRLKHKNGIIKTFEGSFSITIGYHEKDRILIILNEIIEDYGLKTEVPIIEDKETEFRIKKSEERLKYLISSSPSVIYTARASKDFIITFMSENVTEKTGYDPDDFLKNPRFWETKIHPEDKQLVLSRLSQLSTSENLGFEYRLKFKDGLYHWVRHDIKLIKDDKGIPTETIGSLID
ncbi:MAG: PAS domain-containing protein, partial [Candidatus Lokiarchaeota archaeon]|nr:PAS domain-containing protein [Candidatus Lokiarchaeota archaeon]